MKHALVAAFAALAAVVHTLPAHAQQRIAASGERLVTFNQRATDSEGDRHSLRARIRDSVPPRSAMTCAALSRGQPRSNPTILSDGTLAVVTESPPGIAFFADGRLVRHVTSAASMNGPVIEGADGRVIVVDDSPAVRMFAPDGTERASVPLPGQPLGGAAILSDGSIVVSLAGAPNTEIIVLSPDLSAQSRYRLPGTLSNPYLFRGTQSSLWLMTNVGPHVIEAGRPVPTLLAWARTARAAWQTDEDTLVVQVGDTTPAELRFTSRNGVLRRSITQPDQIYLLPRGHLALSQPYTADPSGTSGTTTTGPTPTRPTPIRPGWGRPAAPPTNTELVIYDRRGTNVTRALLPNVRLAGIMLDADDAVLALTSTGHLTAIEPSGTIRWDADFSVEPLFDPVALPEGGFAVSVRRPRAGVCVLSL